MNVKEEDCKTAASQLGFEGSLQVGSWSWAPPGCLVGHPTDGWKKLYYNKFTNGTLGRDIYKSVCKSKSKLGSCLVMGIMIFRSLLKDDSCVS